MLWCHTLWELTQAVVCMCVFLDTTDSPFCKWFHCILIISFLLNIPPKWRHTTIWAQKSVFPHFLTPTIYISMVGTYFSTNFSCSLINTYIFICFTWNQYFDGWNMVFLRTTLVCVKSNRFKIAHFLNISCLKFIWNSLV